MKVVIPVWLIGLHMMKVSCYEVVYRIIVLLWCFFLGWILKVKLRDESELKILMDETAYLKFVGTAS